MGLLHGGSSNRQCLHSIWSLTKTFPAHRPPESRGDSGNRQKTQLGAQSRALSVVPNSAQWTPGWLGLLPKQCLWQLMAGQALAACFLYIH